MGELVHLKFSYGNIGLVKIIVPFTLKKKKNPLRAHGYVLIDPIFKIWPDFFVVVF